MLFNFVIPCASASVGLKPSSAETGIERDTHPNFMLCGTCQVLCEDNHHSPPGAPGTGCEKQLLWPRWQTARSVASTIASRLSPMQFARSACRS
jgi:hypothetical protein